MSIKSVRLIGDQGQYCAIEDMVFPNPNSERMGELEWICRYNPDSLTKADHMYMASVLGAYREIVLNKTVKDRNAVCSSIRCTGLVTDAKLNNKELE